MHGPKVKALTQVFLHYYNTRPNDLVSWLSLVGQARSFLFAPYLLSFKNFKMGFFRIMVNLVGLTISMLIRWKNFHFTGLEILLGAMIDQGVWWMTMVWEFWRSLIYFIFSFLLRKLLKSLCWGNLRRKCLVCFLLPQAKIDFYLIYVSVYAGMAQLEAKLGKKNMFKELRRKVLTESKKNTSNVEVLEEPFL